jgi:thiamine-monophosphate kinase
MPPAANAVLGVGDDCALLNVTNGMDLAVSTDTMVSARISSRTSIPSTSATSRSR